MVWQVYILECSDKTLYTGITNNLKSRVSAHNNGTASKCTRSSLPVNLVYYIRFNTRSEALNEEARIKRLSRRDKLTFIDS